MPPRKARKAQAEPQQVSPDGETSSLPIETVGHNPEAPVAQPKRRGRPPKNAINALVLSLYQISEVNMELNSGNRRNTNQEP